MHYSLIFNEPKKKKSRFCLTKISKSIHFLSRKYLLHEAYGTSRIGGKKDVHYINLKTSKLTVNTQTLPEVRLWSEFIFEFLWIEIDLFLNFYYLHYLNSENYLCWIMKSFQKSSNLSGIFRRFIRIFHIKVISPSFDCFCKNLQTFRTGSNYSRYFMAWPYITE